MQTSDFFFDLPSELIAQAPVTERDRSRLLVFDRNSRSLSHHIFLDLPLHLRPTDVLVLNDSRVIPARLRGLNSKTGGQFEILLLEENALNDWWVMLRPGKRAREGTEIILRDAAGNATEIRALVTDINAEGHRRLKFSGVENIRDQLDA